MQARQLIVIQGEEEVAIKQAKFLVNKFPDNQVITENTLIKSVLGGEYLAVIYNCYQGFDPDLLGAVGGTIIAGGVLILVTPPFHQWPDFTDPFNERIANWPYQAKNLKSYYLQRFIRKLKQADFVTIYDTQCQISALDLPRKVIRDEFFKREDQSLAVKAILNKIQNNQQLAIVLEADRGRGKSAVLGMLVKAIQTEPKDKTNIQANKVLVTAPSKKTAEVVFRHAGESNQLCFIAPDQLCHEFPKADLLLIDEAAAIPSSLLTIMLEHYSKIIFSTTVHGYEGTGRGFALRFKQQLDHIKPNWQKLRLEQPIRYAENDPLEKFIFDSLMLDVQPVERIALNDVNLQGCRFNTLSSKELMNDESLLREVFGLLVLAHYQTRPTDLRHMLDGKNVSVSIIQWKKHVVATALSVEEGGFDKELAHAIHYGKRRPRGHLVPQSLAVHAGIAKAPLLLTTRVMRIVVHPEVQRRGIASLLLKNIERISNSDYLSSSFGATHGLLKFWNKQGYQSVRVGLSRNASSGRYSVIVIKPLNNEGKALLKIAVNQFQRYLPSLISEPLKDIEEELIRLLQTEDKQISNGSALEALIITDQDKIDIHSFAYGFRGYENCMLALHKLVLASRNEQTKWAQLTDIEKQLVEDKILHQVSWKALIKPSLWSGKKQALMQLRQSIKSLIS